MTTIALKPGTYLARASGSNRPTLAGRAAGRVFPDGVRGRGFNLTYKPDDLVSSPRASNDNGDWRNMYDEWDWVGWIKWQVDLAYNAGANFIRTLGGIDGLPIAYNLYSTATYLNRWRQLIEYVGSLGMWVYANCFDRSQWVKTPGANITYIQANDHLADFVTMLAEYPEIVCALDIDQEINARVDTMSNVGPVNYTWADTLTAIDLNLSTARAIMPALPLTFSNYRTPTQAASDSFIADMKTRLDFWDFHIYGAAGTDPASTYFNNLWSNSSKPLMCGEFGINQLFTAGQITSRQAAIKTLFQDGNMMGIGAWAVGDQATTDTDDLWGYWANDGTPRSTLITPWQENFPKVVAGRSRGA